MVKSEWNSRGTLYSHFYRNSHIFEPFLKAGELELVIGKRLDTTNTLDVNSKTLLMSASILKINLGPNRFVPFVFIQFWLCLRMRLSQQGEITPRIYFLSTFSWFRRLFRTLYFFLASPCFNVSIEIWNHVSFLSNL